MKKDIIAALAGLCVIFLLYQIHPILAGIASFLFLILWSYIRSLLDD